MIWRLGVAGYPIEHSLSPALHVAGLEQADLDGTSLRIPLHEEQADALGELVGSRFDALSITMPLKGAAIHYCDELTEEAERTGSVNSMLARDGNVLGACTDGLGLLAALRADVDLDVSGARVAVLGAGGAARGIVDALVAAGAQEVFLRGRSPEKVAALVARYAPVTSDAAVGPLDLVINTTPDLARHASEGVEAGVTEATVAVDIVYEPRTTPWMRQYAARGCRVTNGLSMLAYQAALQMEWWFGQPIDGARLREAIQ